MNRGPDGNMPQLHRVARLDRRLGTRHDRVARLQALGRQDVTTFAVAIKHQRQMRGAVRIVFDALHLAGNAVLVAQKIHHAVVLLVTAALMPHRLAAEVVARARAVLADDQRFERPAFMQVRAVDLDLKTPPR